MKRIVSLCVALLLLVCLIPIGGVSVSAANEDLAVTSFSWNTATEITPGTPVTFSVTIKNGRTAITEPFTITFGTATQTFTTVTYNSSLNANASVTIKSEPWTAVAGDYMVAAYVNASGTIPETDKRNNSMQASLRVANNKLTSAYASTQAMLETCGLTSLIFNDDFNDLSSVDTQNTGAPGYKWYVHRPYGASTLTTDDYSVKNGVMTLHNIKPTYNYGLGTYNANTRVGWSYNLGYMEVRLRIPRPRENTDGEKGVPAIWALPPQKLTNSASKWVEMDWMEYWGINAYNSDWPDGFYTVCLHEQNISGTIHYKNSNYQLSGLGDAEWHVMGWLWQEGLFITYLDGVEVMRQTYSATSVPEPRANTIKGDSTADKTGVYSILDTQYNPIIIGGSKDNPMELDYIRVWDGNRTANPGVPPETIAKSFVETYLTDSDGNLIKAATEDNYGYIITSEKEWNTLDAAAKTQVDVLLKANGLPTYATLLAQAKAIYNGPTTTTKKPTTTTKKPTTTTKPIGGGGVTSTTKPTTSTVGSTSATAATVATGGDTTTTVTTLPDQTLGTTADTTVATTVATKPVSGDLSDENDAGDKPSFPTLLVVIVAAVVLLGAAVTVLLLRKRSAK